MFAVEANLCECMCVKGMHEYLHIFDAFCRNRNACVCVFAGIVLTFSFNESATPYGCKLCLFERENWRIFFGIWFGENAPDEASCR